MTDNSKQKSTMRTYTRKKPEYELIDGVQELCRLCLGKYTSSVKIFSDDCTDVCGPLVLRIMICVGLEITREDCLPNDLCLECYRELERYYKFRKKCEISYQKLKSHLMAVKERERLQKLFELENNYGQDTIITDNLVQEEQKDQKLELSFNGNSPPELVNIVNEIPVSNLQESNSLTNSNLQHNNLENNEGQVQAVSIDVKSNTPTIEIETSDAPVSMILSSILIELGVLQQQPGGLVMIDENLKTVEIEGEDNTLMLEIIEEDEEVTSTEPEQGEVENIDRKMPMENGHGVETILYKTRNKYTDGNTKRNLNHSCSTCGKRFSSRSVVARHQRVHSGERPFACDTCGRRFAQREVLNRHRFVHQARRPFACAQCPKSFTQRRALAAHEQAHAPAHERSLALHRCGFCPKVFLYASGLSRHMIMHAGKVFVCNVCDKDFSDKSSLVRHHRNSHLKAEAPPQPDSVTSLTVASEHVVET